MIYFIFKNPFDMLIDVSAYGTTKKHKMEIADGSSPNRVTPLPTVISQSTALSLKIRHKTLYGADRPKRAANWMRPTMTIITI